MTNLESKKAALIVKPHGSGQWFRHKLGSFLECKAMEKIIKNNFKETKVIYQFNLNNYGIPN